MQILTDALENNGSSGCQRLRVFLGGFAALAKFRRALLLTRNGRRFEGFTPSRFRNDAFVLNAARETAQHSLKALALSVFYLYQLNSILLWSRLTCIADISTHLP